MYLALFQKCEKSAGFCSYKRINRLNNVISHVKNESLLANSGNLNPTSGPHSSDKFLK